MTHLLAKAAVGMDYAAYRARVDQVVAAGATTGPEQSDKRIDATKLNQARMRRLDKTVRLSDQLLAALHRTPPQTWIVISEAWCGDAAQNLPALAAMANEAPHITLRILLRDEHLDLMDRYLTGGSRSIPKLIAVDALGQELFTWGPRPAEPHRMVIANKALPPAEQLPYEQLTETVHRWYNADHTAALQQEILEKLAALER